MSVMLLFLSQIACILRFSLCICKLIETLFPVSCENITKSYLYNFDPLKPHFYIVKLGFTRVDIIFFISAPNIDCGYLLEPPNIDCGYSLEPLARWF